MRNASIRSETENKVCLPRLHGFLPKNLLWCVACSQKAAFKSDVSLWSHYSEDRRFSEQLFVCWWLWTRMNFAKILFTVIGILQGACLLALLLRPSSCIPIKKNCINATSGEAHTCERSCWSSHANGASGIFMYSVIEGSPRNHTIKTAAAPVRAVGKFREEIQCGQWLCVQLWHHSKT